MPEQHSARSVREDIGGEPEAPPRLKGFAEPALIAFLSQLTGLVFATIAGIVLARSLGPAGKGILALISLLGGIGTLVSSLGLGNSLVYHIASGDHKTETLVQSCLVLVLGSSCVVISSLWLSFPLLVRGPLYGMNRSSLLAASLLIGLQNYTAVFLSTARGLQRIRLASVLLQVSRIISSVGAITLVVLGIISVNSAVAVFVVSAVVSLGASWWSVRDVNLLDRIDIVRCLRAGRGLLSFGLKSFLTSLTQFFNYRLDAFLVNMWLGPAQLGIYSVAVTGAELMFYIPRSMVFVLLPKTARTGTVQARKAIPSIIRQVELILLVAGVVLSIVSPYALPLLYGDEFRGGVLPLLILVPGIMGLSTGWMLGAHFEGIGVPLHATAVTGFSLVVTVVGNLVLIPRLGIAGAAMASTTAYLAAGLLSVWLFVSLDSGVRISIKELLLPQRSDFRVLGKVSYRLFRKMLSLGK